MKVAYIVLKRSLSFLVVFDFAVEDHFRDGLGVAAQVHFTLLMVEGEGAEVHVTNGGDDAFKVVALKKKSFHWTSPNQICYACFSSWSKSV